MKFKDLLLKLRQPTSGTALSFGKAGSTIRVNVNGKIITAIAANEINSSNISVVTDSTGQAWARSSTAPIETHRRTGQFLHILDEEQPTTVYSLKILYTVLNDAGNWDVFVGGHQPTPIKITTIASEQSNLMGILHGYITNDGTKNGHIVGLVQKKIESYSVTPPNVMTILHSYFPGGEYYQYSVSKSFGSSYIGFASGFNNNISVYKWRGLGYWDIYPRIPHLGWSAYYFSTQTETNPRLHDGDLGYHQAKIFPRELVYKDQKDFRDVELNCRFIDSGDTNTNPVDFVEVKHQTPYDFNSWSNISTDTYNYIPSQGTIIAASISKTGDYPFSLSLAINNTSTPFSIGGIDVLQEGFVFPLLFNSTKTRLLMRNLVNYSFTSVDDALSKSIDGYDAYYNKIPYVWQNNNNVQQLTIDASLSNDININYFFQLEPEQTALDKRSVFGTTKFYDLYFSNPLANIATLPPGAVGLSSFIGNTLYIVEQPTLPRALGAQLRAIDSIWERGWAVDDYNTPVDKNSTMNVRAYQITSDNKIKFLSTKKVNVFNLKIPQPTKLGTYRILAVSYYPG